MHKFLKNILLISTSVVLLTAILIVGVLWIYSNDIPDYKFLKNYKPPVSSKVYSGEGELVADFSKEKRIFVPYSTIPKNVINAFLSAEDKNFFSHPGVDAKGVLRAFVNNISNIISSKRLEGASTITQQVAKNFLLTNEVSINRKIKEAILAFRIERALSKERILELYLNQIYLGSGAYGVAAASLEYFDKSIRDLNYSEAALLAALPKAPSRYNPYRDIELAKFRRNLVLKNLFDNNYITSKWYEKLKNQEIVLVKNKKIYLEDAQYFIEDVRKNVIESFFKTGFFSDITISTDGSQLNIALVENPYIKYFDLKNKGDTGLSAWLKNEQFYLTEESISILADENNLSPGNIFNKMRFEDFILFIKAKYNQAGYFNAQIEYETSIDLQNRIGINLTIEQGVQARVNEINISGNKAFESKEILRLFEIGKSRNILVNYFTNKDLFTENELQSGLDLLTQKYFDSGYLDFKILDLKTEFSDNNEKIAINIEVNEGIQYKVGDISFTGQLGKITNDDLKKLLEIKSGDVFNRQIVISDIQKITDLYADQGYAFVNINPITSDFLDTVNITIDIFLNKKVYVNRIIISGNTRTLDEVIRREIGISEGGLYSRSTLRESIMSLRRLGYFSNVEIEANDIPGVNDKIDLLVQVEETKTGAVNFSVSHSNTYGISFGAV